MRTPTIRRSLREEEEKTYCSARKRQDGIRLHREITSRQDRVCGGVEVGAAWVLEEVGIPVDDSGDAGCVETGWGRRRRVWWSVVAGKGTAGPSVLFCQGGCGGEEGEEGEECC